MLCVHTQVYHMTIQVSNVPVSAEKAPQGI